MLDIPNSTRNPELPPRCEEFSKLVTSPKLKFWMSQLELPASIHHTEGS